MTPIITKYGTQDIFNMEKTALFYNAHPKRAMTLKGEMCQGGKEYKDSTTILFCHTEDGSNLSSNCWKV
jgi:hypothetical protein